MCAHQKFKVTATGLNLRSKPIVETGNIIAVLPQNQIVEKLADATDAQWWRVSTEIQGVNQQGFVAHQFLTPLVTGSTSNFGLPEPSDGDRAKTLTLWATFYNVHLATEKLGGIPLLDTSDNRLGPVLSEQDWCQAAVEGTVTILDSAGQPSKTFNFAASGSTPQVNCKPFFPGLDPSVLQGTNRARFTTARGKFGDGTGGFSLVPFRTIAVDPSFIPIGSIIYVPDARGQAIVLPSGDRVTHDGYFFAADVGGAITGTHIDVFLGPTNHNPFPWVQSAKDKTFTAFLIKNTTVETTLKKLHQP